MTHSGRSLRTAGQRKEGWRKVGRRKVLNARQVSELTATAARTLYDWAASKSHPFPKPINISSGHKGFRWDAQEVADYLDRQFDERDERWAAIRGMLRSVPEASGRRKRA